MKLSLLLVERFSSDIWYCPECDDAAKLNMNGVRMVEKEDCKHIFASKILTDMTKEKDLDMNEKDQIFIVLYYGKHAISDKGTDWSRPLPSSKTDHRCALLHHLLTILCQLF